MMGKASTILSNFVFRDLTFDCKGMPEAIYVVFYVDNYFYHSKHMSLYLFCFGFLLSISVVFFSNLGNNLMKINIYQ